MKRCVGGMLLVLHMMAQGAVGAAPRLINGPYKDLALWADPVTHVIGESVGGAVRPYLEGSPVGALSWAFATGECGAETWAGQRGEDVAAANVAQFDRAGVDYIISTGGQGGVFTCATDAAMERFIARYSCAHLLGIDFDIEAGQSAAQVEALVARVRPAQRRHPRLRFSFTVATFAASDGSRRSLNAQGEAILAAIRRARVHATLNLMVMDYGPAAARNCVVKDALCDMGASALQAAHNVSEKYKVPMAQLELTAMIGRNDVIDNVFGIDDARAMARAAREHKMAGLHFWSLDRDRPCEQENASAASSTCNGVQGARRGEFARAFSDVAKAW